MQRQLAIQRLQEQEKERQMRLEQQKHTIQMRAQMPAFPLPYAQVLITHWNGTSLEMEIYLLVKENTKTYMNWPLTLLSRCSLCLLMWLEGMYTSLVVHQATLALSALLVLWRAHLCTTCIWVSLGRTHLYQDSTRLCLRLPQVREIHHLDSLGNGLCAGFVQLDKASS